MFAVVTCAFPSTDGIKAAAQKLNQEKVASKRQAADLASNDHAQATPDAHVPSAQTVELHHSLHRPMDSTSAVYWNFGGSTVLTRRQVRLTPATSNRRGYLWNDYGIESDNWEIEFEVDVFSKPHFGGDGFAFWLLHSSQDPSFQTDPEYLLGSVFGMREDFRGVGIVVDVYDNNGSRDNPSIFVLHNPTGERTNYNHDNDYANDMYKKTAPGTNAAYSCVANVRNTGAPTKFMVKFLRQILHVYVDTDDGLGYKFCLAVQFDEAAPFRDHHIAFSAMTGQVADAHDVLHLSTKYLTGEEEEIDDSQFAVANDRSGCSTMVSLFRSVLLLGWIACLGAACYELVSFKTKKKAHINAVLICDEINSVLVPHYYAYFALFALLVITFDIYGVLMNLPLVLLRAYQFSKRNWKLSTMQVGGEKVHGSSGLSFQTRCYIAIFIYFVGVVYFFLKWMRC